jgi:hypothetical protein
MQNGFKSKCMIIYFRAPEAGSQTGKVVSMVTGPALTHPMQNYIPQEWEIHQVRMGGQQHVIEHFQRTVVG